MPTIGEAFAKAYPEMKPYDIMAVDLRLLLMHDEGLAEQIDVITNKDKEMKNYPLFLEQLEELKTNKPVEYVIHEAQFLSRRLYVDENVLIPRSETEELVANLTERIDAFYDPRNYLVCADIGTGSGAIAMALRDAFPNWLLLASDNSKKALAVAQKNFQLANLNITTYLGDALEPYIKNRIALDILISNPPYILNKEDAQASVRNFEPASALWMDQSNSVYEKIFRDCSKVKKGSLYMAFEISPDLVSWLEGLMRKYLSDYKYTFVEDLNKMKRFLFVYLK